MESDPKNRFDSALDMREALTHPDSVVITHRAARTRPKSRLPPWARVALTILGGVATFAALWLVLFLVTTLLHRQ